MSTLNADYYGNNFGQTNGANGFQLHNWTPQQSEDHQATYKRAIQRGKFRCVIVVIVLILSQLHIPIRAIINAVHDHNKHHNHDWEPGGTVE